IRVPQRGHRDPGEEVDILLAVAVHQGRAVPRDEDLFGALVGADDVFVHACPQAVNVVPVSGDSARSTASGPSAGAIFTSAPGRASSAASAASTLGIMPAAIVPAARSSAHRAAVRRSIRRPPSSTPGTSLKNSTAPAPNARASGPHAWSALTL